MPMGVTENGTIATADSRSFEGEALPCLDAVFRFAQSLTHERADADDLVQETFLRAYRSWRTFLPGMDCRRWLFAICHNAFLRSREKRQRRDLHEQGDMDALPAVMLHAHAVRDGTDVLLTQIDLVPALRGALEMLAEPFRSVVVLVDQEGYSYQEVAELLAVPVGTVRSRLYRGRRFLQEVLFAHARDVGLGCAGTKGKVLDHG
jgi:RNA polymerase sigma-70 factor (ECF subfamily)